MEFWGKRFERLMFGAAPVAALTLLAFYLELGSDRQDKLLAARCFEKAAEVFNSADVQNELSRAYGERRRDPEVYPTVVKLVLNQQREKLSEACPDLFVPNIGPLESNGTFKMFQPSDIPGQFTRFATDLRASAPRSLGVSFPDASTVELVSNKITIQLHVTLALLLAFLTAVLIIWSGSLLATRRREIAQIARRSAPPYPHAMNNFPSTGSPSGIRTVHGSWISNTSFLYRLFIWLMIACLPMGLFIFALVHAVVRVYGAPLFVSPGETAGWIDWVSITIAIVASIPIAWRVQKTEVLGMRLTSDT